MMCVADESGTNGSEWCRRVVSGRKFAGVVRSLVNARSLQLKFAIVLHEALLGPVLLYGSEATV